MSETTVKLSPTTVRACEEKRERKRQSIADSASLLKELTESDLKRREYASIALDARNGYDTIGSLNERMSNARNDNE